jgi:hypothetical protein
VLSDVEFILQNDKIFIFGSDPEGMYLECFHTETGSNIFRFCTCYWFDRVSWFNFTEIEELIKKLKDKSPVVRYYVAKALGRRGEKASSSIPALIQALKDEDSNVRCIAAETIGEIGTTAVSAVPALIEALEDKDWSVRKAAAKTLKKLTGKNFNPKPELDKSEESEFGEQ